MDRAREIEALERRMHGTGRSAEEVRRRLVIARRRAWLRWALGSKRALDAGSAFLLLVALSPLLAVLLAACRGRLTRQTRLGRWAEPFEMVSFDFGPKSVVGRLGLHRLPVVVNILRGELSWIGPRALQAAELTAADRQQWRRWDLRPGLLSLWWIRTRANNNYGTEWETDAEYGQDAGVWNDMGIVARAIPAALYGSGAAITEDEISVLGLRMDNLTMSEAVDWIGQRIRTRETAAIRFLNADCANRAWSDGGYRDVLNSAGLTLADGIGLKLAGQILGRPVRQNVNGTDLFPKLCARLAEGGHSLFLLGAKPGVAELVAAWAVENHKEIRIAGVRDGYFSAEQDEDVVRQISAASPDVLLVAFGAPRQDVWIAARAGRLGAGVAMGVGGLFDFYSGRIPRAPQWMRDMAVEWLYRFWQEPGRMWRRYFVGNFVFLLRVGLERLGRRPWEK